ncbi:HPP family protein [Sphingobium sufflavum]|uniref:HPP family protein n=1 Tax=Sphingobium sufflavum TaxID=1129547 RepID=UPI001F376626|nr:HPP family protein [Sphingobium sufflavum]MCE7797317.1 HPP family protein [Sphingobium sufflavum]
MTDPSAPPGRQRRVWSRYYATFIDVPAGPDWRDRIRAAAGAVGGIAFTGLLCAIMLGNGLSHPLLVAPMGASAVLLFAVPASPLAQPWSIIGGNVCSALVGVLVVNLVTPPMLAAALAVGGAIIVMSLLRCLHPPGGAVALTGVLGGAGGASAHYSFAFVPIGLNSLLLVLVGILFHRFSGHSYPHRVPVVQNSHATRDALPLDRAGLSHDDVEDAVAAYGETLDVDPDDLHIVFKDAELRASVRRHGALTAGDIMSRDIITIGREVAVKDAAALLYNSRLLSLPVMDRAGRVEGIITPLDLGREGASAYQIASDPLTVSPDTPLVALVRPLSEGRRHEILVLDGGQRLCGIVTQTDLIAALAVT